MVKRGAKKKCLSRIKRGRGWKTDLLKYGVKSLSGYALPTIAGIGGAYALNKARKGVKNIYNKTSDLLKNTLSTGKAKITEKVTGKKFIPRLVGDVKYNVDKHISGDKKTHNYYEKEQEKIKAIKQKNKGDIPENAASLSYWKSKNLNDQLEGKTPVETLKKVIDTNLKKHGNAKDFHKNTNLSNDKTEGGLSAVDSAAIRSKHIEHKKAKPSIIPFLHKPPKIQESEDVFYDAPTYDIHPIEKRLEAAGRKRKRQ